MSFTPNIPANGQSLGSSRTQVLDNFAVLRSTLAENHVDVNAANAGLHTHADLLAQSADPNPASGIVSHYSKTIAGITEWFFQREGTMSGNGAVIQMSNGTPSAGTSGRTFLPGGLILLWGQCNFNTGSTLTQNFQGTGFPNNAFTIQITPFILPGAGNPLSLAAAPISKTQFNVQGRVSNGSFSASPGAFYWAIGN